MNRTIEAIINEPALASVTAVTECTIIAITKRAFLDALHTDAQFSFLVLQTVTGFAVRAYRALEMQLSPSWAQVAVQVLAERARTSGESELGMKVVRIQVTKLCPRVSSRQLNKFLKELRAVRFESRSETDGTISSVRFLDGVSRRYLVNPGVEQQALVFAKE